MREPKRTRGTGTADGASIDAAFAAEGLVPHRWSNGPGDLYAVHDHAYDKVLYCLRGSITFTMPAAGVTTDLAPGDRLDLPAGTPHGAIVGPGGVDCMEAARPAAEGSDG